MYFPFIANKLTSSNIRVYSVRIDRGRNWDYTYFSMCSEQGIHARPVLKAEYTTGHQVHANVGLVSEVVLFKFTLCMYHLCTYYNIAKSQ